MRTPLSIFNFAGKENEKAASLKRNGTFSGSNICRFMRGGKAQKANNERVSEHKLLQTKIALEREEKARLNAMLNLSQVKHLVGLLLRRRTLQEGEYTEKELRLLANEQTIQRITDELAVLLNVSDPSEKLDSDPEEEDE